uniref:Ig-like domain-containing protein n=1 Tax=Ornithorhynchus anatinus TaxID=9258 RepID=A0A6I8NBD5_ORNAN
MGPGTVWLVAVCVLGAGPVDAEVTQTPRHLVTSQGQNVTLSCVPISSHSVLFWYRQRMRKGLELVMFIQNKQIIQGMQSNDSSRFSISWFQKNSCHLHVKHSSTSDSAVYLCASS